MAISPIQKKPIPTSSPSLKALAKPRPQGLAQIPDRLEDRRPPAYQENPPSLFKKFLFEPIFYVAKLILRGIFTFFDFLRKTAFEETETPAPLGKDLFLERLRSAPPPEKLLLQFNQLYSRDEQNRVYWAIGEAHQAKDSWKEFIWDRSTEGNIALGRRLVRENPFLLRDYLF
jgi:hypothetical protein